MFRREGIDFLFCYMSTYAMSSTVLPVVQRAGVPMVILSLQPTKAMDYANGTTFMQLEHDNQTSLPEICNALERADIHLPGMVVGTLYDDDVAWQQILDWCNVARVYAAVRNARIGVMGHVYEGMLDMNSDPTMFDGFFGMHCEHIELDDLRSASTKSAKRNRRASSTRSTRSLTFPKPAAIPSPGRPSPRMWPGPRAWPAVWTVWWIALT